MDREPFFDSEKIQRLNPEVSLASLNDEEKASVLAMPQFLGIVLETMWLKQNQRALSLTDDEIVLLLMRRESLDPVKFEAINSQFFDNYPVMKGNNPQEYTQAILKAAEGFRQTAGQPTRKDLVEYNPLDVAWPIFVDRFEIKTTAQLKQIIEEGRSRGFGPNYELLHSL